MGTVTCRCGGTMEYDFRIWGGIEEYEDFYKCVICGVEKNAFEVDEEERGN